MLLFIDRADVVVNLLFKAKILDRVGKSFAITVDVVYKHGNIVDLVAIGWTMTTIIYILFLIFMMTIVFFFMR